jgi:hypothetical protein
MKHGEGIRETCGVRDPTRSKGTVRICITCQGKHPEHLMHQIHANFADIFLPENKQAIEITMLFVRVAWLPNQLTDVH